jgi:hypothetical protein
MGMSKKIVKKPKKTSPKSSSVVNDRINVNIKKANNGFVVSSWDSKFDKDRIFIAKTKKEAKAFADKLLEI